MNFYILINLTAAAIDNIGPICEELGKLKLKQVEVDFPEEYVTVMEPLAVVLDQLQGDRHCCYRMLVPKLTQLRYKLSVLAVDNSTYCNPLSNSFLSELNSRYARMFSLDLTESEAKDAIMAAV